MRDKHVILRKTNHFYTKIFVLFFFIGLSTINIRFIIERWKRTVYIKFYESFAAKRESSA